MAIAALFGPAAMQAVMSGQAFVGVVVSGVQLLSAAASIHSAEAARAMNVSYDKGAAEARAARLFFGLSSVFLCVTLAAYAWLIRIPEYNAVVRPFEDVKSNRLGNEERNPLRGEDSDAVLAPPEKDFEQIVRVAKMNSVYEFTVAYVFVVTLVRDYYFPISVDLIHPLAGRLPAHNHFHPTNFAFDPSPSLHLRSLPRVQSW